MWKRRGGEIIELRGIEVHLPPMPPKEEILGHNLPKADQKWENVRPALPVFKARDIKLFSKTEYTVDDELTWDMARREEIIGKTGYDPWQETATKYHKVSGVEADPNYHDPMLSEFRNREIKRLLEGVWFYNDGEPTYLTGAAYLLFSWWPIDRGRADYRDYIRKIYYIFEHADLCPSEIGAIVAGPRGMAKSTISTCFLYHRAMFSKKQRFGIQSKTDNDAEMLFMKGVVQPFLELPDFLIPINSAARSKPPKSTLEFFRPTKRHPSPRWDKYLSDNAKGSIIDYRSSGDIQYDGETMRVLVQDEIGKITAPNSVANRFAISRFCVYRGDYKSGVLIGITTVGEMEKGGAEFKEVWDGSDPTKVNKVGWTQTGCIRYFVSALDTVCLDEYGRSDRARARAFHEEQLKTAKMKSDREYYTYLRQNPFEEADMFKMGGGSNEYNLEILLNRQELLDNSEVYRKVVKIGNFVWEEKYKKAKFVENQANGLFHVSWEPPEHLRNNVRDRGRYFEPLNGRLFAAALDPVNVNNPKIKSKASQVAFSILKKQWEGEEDDSELANVFVCDYLGRHPDTTIDYDNILCAAWFYGVPILIEDNQGAAIRHYQQVGADLLFKHGGETTFCQPKPEFLVKGGMRTKHMQEHGISATKSIIATYSELTRNWIERHGHKLNHIRIVRDWINFDPEETKEYDSGVAASYAIVASHKEKHAEPQKKQDISGIGFRKRRIRV